MVRRSSLILAIFLAYSVGIAAPCYCAAHMGTGATAESHACCQSDTAARTSARATCCCDDRDQPTETVVVPDAQTHSTPVFVAVIDATEAAPLPERSLERLSTLNDIPRFVLLPGSSPDRRAPPA